MSWRLGFRPAAALAIGVFIGAPFALGQESSGPPPKDTIFARKILMGAIGTNMDEIETMLAPNGKFDADAHFAQENGAFRPRLLPFCYHLAYPKAASMTLAARSSAPWTRWP